MSASLTKVTPLPTGVQNGLARGALPSQKPFFVGRSSHAIARPHLRVAQVSDAVVAGDALTPAVLPGTPTDYPIKPDELIRLAKVAFETNTGVDDDSVLADDFRFEFPIISLDRAAYLKAVRGFGLKNAIPDLDPHPYDWRVDPYEPNRVWFTIRTCGTHTGPLKFGRSTYAATGRPVRGAPECCSYVFNSEGKVVSFTGGVVMDRRVGNTGGLGALFGILTAIGVKVPKPGSFGWGIAVAVNGIFTWFSKIFGKKSD